jgi:hypothetical protein
MVCSVRRFSALRAARGLQSVQRMNRTLWLSLIAGCLLSSCMEEDEPGPRTREVFCRDFAAAACNEEVVSFCQATDAEACREAQEDFCRTIVPDTFAGERSEVCIEAVAAAYADGDLTGTELVTVRLLGAPCDQLSRGPRGEGQSCMERDDCDAASGFDCVMKSNSMSGTCEIPESVGPGEDCEADQAVCTGNFFCNGENCIAARDLGDSCMHHEECGDEGFCDVDGECAARLATGVACDEDAQCERGICYDFDDERTCTDRIRLGRTEPICDDLR